jgi:hypothetical protein
MGSRHSSWTILVLRQAQDEDEWEGSGAKRRRGPCFLSSVFLAFAENAAERTVDVSPSPNPLPQGGEGLSVLSPRPEGEGWVRALFQKPLPHKPRRAIEAVIDGLSQTI